jgi:hypothetical protein
VNSVMLSYDRGFACWLQRQKNGLHGGRTYDQCQADSLRDGVSDRVFGAICLTALARAYRRVAQSRICTTV